MSAQHTPGPWRTFNGTDVFSDDNDTSGSKQIADCSMSLIIPSGEQVANARLIAAAPDLLAALEGLRGGELWTQAAEDAIAKARGAA
jgi:hypothetical protein